MVDQPDSKYEVLIAILDFSFSKVVTEFFKNSKLPIHLATHGYGSAESEIYDILGFGSPKKIVVLSVQTSAVSKYILSRLQSELELNKPGTGIAFTIPISSLSSVLSQICRQANNFFPGSEGISMTAQESYGLIITIVNSGHFDEVMEAAKVAGATGGTMIHARGLGSEEAAKFLGITIQPEKDVVLIIAPQEKKQAIMERITLEAGINTAGKGICFALPVSTVIGLGAKGSIEP